MSQNDERPVILKYAWDYFLAHAQARLTTFRYYLLFTAIIGAGLVATEPGDKTQSLILSILMAFITIVYWQIDHRHKALIKRAQKALAAIEESDLFDTFHALPKARLFAADFEEKSAHPLMPTYSKLVGSVFLVFFFGSLCLAWYSFNGIL